MGLHWAFLQSVAWVGMVVTYAQHESLPTALSKTFDGKHPCELCRAVAKGQQSEKHHDPLTTLKKQGLVGATVSVTSLNLSAPEIEPVLIRRAFSAPNRPHTPPSPPPRLA